MKFPDGSGSGSNFTIDASDLLDNLSMIFMGGFEARNNRWSIITDVVYLDESGNKNKTLTTGSGLPINASVDMDLSTWLLSGAVGYDVVQSDGVTLAVIGGVRYATVDVDVKLGLQGRQTEKSDSDGLLDGIVGIRGFIKLNEN